MTNAPVATVRRRGAHVARRSETPALSALTLPEVVVGSVVVLVAVFAWMALLLIDNHVGYLGWVSLTALGAVGIIAGLVVVLPRPAIQADPWTFVVLAVLAGFAVFLFFPGFSYGITDKDPGVYVALGAAFARYHSYSFPDVLAQHVPNIVSQTPGARWPAIWVVPHTTTIIPQFYHLWPALLSMAYDIGGLRLEVAVGPFVGVLGVCAVALLLRRAVPGVASLPAAAIGGLLLETNMMEVWQAKYPSTEIFAQLLFVTILLAVCIALATGWRPAAGAAGLLLGIGWLERPDMVLFVAIAAVAGAALVALRRFDGLAWWFAGGFAAVLPHALWQAYAGARLYSLDNSVPKLTTLVAGVVALAVVAFVVRWVRPVSVGLPKLLAERSWQFWLGFALCAVVAFLMALGFLRPRLFGAQYGVEGGRLVRTFNDQNMRRLSWFLTLSAFPLAGLGLAVVALRKWRAVTWVAVLPPLLVTPVFIDNSRIASRLMWWVRRFVPEVLPAFIILMAIALSAALVWKFRRRQVLAPFAVVLLGLLMATYLRESLPLRHHDEYGGSFQVSAEMASVSGSTTGVYLYGQTGCCTTPEYMFGGALWLERGEYDALMPKSPEAGGYVRQVVAAMPGHPVFIVWDGTQTPALGTIDLVAEKHITASLPMWEEANTSRPDMDGPPIAVDFTIWRVVGT